MALGCWQSLLNREFMVVLRPPTPPPQLRLDDTFSSKLISCVARSQIDGAKIATCKDKSDSFAKLFGMQCTDQQMADCFLALTSHLSQVRSVANVMCLTVCGLSAGCPWRVTVSSGNARM